MSKAWFAPKRYGYGSGLPISWEGWTVLIGFFVGIYGGAYLAFRFLPRETAVVVWGVLMVVLVTALILIARAKTEGGWRWRNGQD